MNSNIPDITKAPTPDTIQKEYEDHVYPNQREGWYHGKISDKYRNGYDQINWNEEE